MLLLLMMMMMVMSNVLVTMVTNVITQTVLQWSVYLSLSIKTFLMRHDAAAPQIPPLCNFSHGETF